MGQEAQRAVKIVAGILANGHFEIGQRGGGVIQQQRAHAAPVKAIQSIRTGGNGLVVGGTGKLELALVHVEVAQFFVITRRWIVANLEFELGDALAAWEGLERLPQQAKVGQRLGK